jgi:hypothetical protein
MLRFSNTPSHICRNALVALCFLGYNIGYKGQKTMTLDTLIFKLETIRREAGTGTLQVLFRDPVEGTLYDEIMPFLTEVLADDSVQSLDLFDAFDLQVGDYYVEI